MKRSLEIILLLVVVLGARSAGAAETCGNGIDDDADGLADEGCRPNATMGVCESPMNCKQTGDVGPVNGSLVYTVPADLSPIVARGPKFEFVRTYMSKYAPPATNYRTAMGTRWQHNFMSWLDKSGTSVIVHLVDGRDVKFTYSSTSGGFDYYVPQAGFHMKHLRQATTSPNNWELRTLTGETYAYNWASPVGKLIEIRDALTTPNKITIAYFTSGTNNGQIDTITDASGKKRFKFTYTSARVTKVEYQTVNGGTGTTRTDVRYVYTGTNPTTVQSTTTTIQTMAYDANNYLAAIKDGASNDIVNFAWVSATPGMNARIQTSEGGIAYEFASSRTGCVGSTVLYFNLASNATCTSDSDCSGNRCGGLTGGANSGRCYRAARCLQTSSPSEDLITLVSPLTPCTGACAPTAEYAWTGLELKGVKLADSNWTSYGRDANGMVTAMSEGDSNSNVADAGGLKTWFTYDANFPGNVTEIRRQSNISASSCDDVNTGGCRREFFTWGASTGLLDSQQIDGFTYNASNSAVSFSSKTDFTYNSIGQLTLTNGPLAGNDDVIERTYWSSTDVFKDGYPNEVKLKKDTTNYVTTVYDGYDHWGNSASQKDPDLTFSCRTYDANRGWVTQVREAMAGQTSCSTTNGADLTTSFVRDTWGRVTKTTLPLGDCQHKVYDTFGRLTDVKLRDDCVASNAGTTETLAYDANGLGAGAVLKDSTAATKFERNRTYYDGAQWATVINPVSSSFSRSVTYFSDSKYDTLTFENSLGKSSSTWDTANRETSRRRYTSASSSNLWQFGYATGPERRVTSVTDDLGKTTTTVYDDMGRRNKVVSPDAGTRLLVYDNASRVVTLVEAWGASGQVTHNFTYDNLDRRLTEAYGTTTCGFSPDTEVTYTYDSSPVSCPVGALCTNQAGRLAYVKTILFCDGAQPDLSMDQETFYAYDANGRIVQEYIRDDSSRTAIQAFAWDKNGNATQVTTPSGVVNGLTLGGAGNSDTNLITTLWRNAGAVTNLLTNIQWMPFGPVTSYDQANTISGTAIHAALSWNLAYRATQIQYAAGAANRTKIDYTEDEKGRYTSKVYSNMSSTVPSTYLTYDWLDRITCDATVTGSCPASGSTLRSKVSFDASNDRTSSYKHQDPAYGDQTYEIFYNSGSDRLSSYAPAGSSIAYSWDDRGNRTAEDDSSSAIDRRDFTYDGRRRVRTISGTIDIGIGTTSYTVTNAYDHRDRRVYRQFSYPVLGQSYMWWFYYDTEDRLSEVKYSNGGTAFTTFQFYWLGRRPVAFVATDSPSGTVARYFIHADETNRPLEVFTWPTSGDATFVWGVNPDAFGWDRVTSSSISYQPLRMNGMYYEENTTATKVASGALDRPPLLADRSATYDPMTATYLLQVGAWPDESYAPRDHNVNLRAPISAAPDLHPRFSESPSCRTVRSTVPVCNGCALPQGEATPVALQQQSGGSGSGSGGEGFCVTWYCYGAGCQQAPDFVPYGPQSCWDVRQHRGYKGKGDGTTNSSQGILCLTWGYVLCSHSGGGGWGGQIIY